MLSSIGGFKKVKLKFIFSTLNYLIKLIKISLTVIYCLFQPLPRTQMEEKEVQS